MNGSTQQKKVKLDCGYVMHTFEDVRDLFYPYIHNEKDRKKIYEAYKFAKERHAGIIRKTGVPYIQHLIEVAYICATLQAGPITLEAAFLHDVIEDTSTQIDEIKKVFGEEVAELVDSLTKIQRLKMSHRTEEEFEAEDRRKIFLGMAKDVRVIIVKLADRLHNMRTVFALKPERQLALAKETLNVFSPIAHRLGIYRIESELVDLSLKILEPDIYKDIEDKLNKQLKNRTKHLNTFKKKIADILIDKNIPFDIDARVKSIYSIYKKMYVKGHPFEEMYDLLALRVITETEINCYEILGLIHQHFKPLPGRFKDYIAMPKPNMYQSLHTTIIAGNGFVFEVQIRTKKMDEIAERGVAAHWRYKEGTHYSAKEEQKQIEEQLHWFRDFVSMSHKNQKVSTEEFENLSKDIFEANVYVFTPKGKVIDLPAGSTPIDMAYKIHTKIGDSIVGSLVNGQLVPLNTKLKTGDVVEIKTSNNASGPNESWLNFVKTNTARSRIKKFLAKKTESLVRADKVEKGRQACIDFFKDRDIGEKETLQLLSSAKVLNNYNMRTVDDLFVAICQRNMTPAQVADYLGIRRKEKLDLNLSKKQKLEDDSCPVSVDNQSGIKISLGNCCTPIPGDNIVGYVTKGKGITVHRHECPNIANNQRLIDVKWKPKFKTTPSPADLILECNDRDGLVADILNSLNSIKIKCTEISAKVNFNNMKSYISCQIYVNDVFELDTVISHLMSIKDVYNVKRSFH